MKPLQDFQEQHPDVVVLTVVDASTDAKDLQRVVREEKLTSLRISRASPELWDKFGATGVPQTFVVDENGNVRVQHFGVIPDVSRYLAADLKAISQAGPVKELVRATTE
jgi:thioredoxin-related protein